jgi:hypothetical protein
MVKHKILVIRFNNQLYKNEISSFRGAVINALENDHDILFHNHYDDRLRYSYPLIQYKRINRKAAIVCIDEGTESIGQLFSNCNFNFRIGDRTEKMDIESVKANQFIIQIWDSKFKYIIRNWLPLNQDSYAKYKESDSLADRIDMLDRILLGNILSFAKGIGVFFDLQVQNSITQLEEPKMVSYKGNKMMSFDAEFESNVSIPDFIGLGKGSSLGHGTVTRRRAERESDINIKE